MTNHFERAYPILEKIEKAGFEAYFVGGCVRDYLLNRPIADVDIATSAYPQEIKTIFSHTFDIGIDHGTVLVLYEQEGYEITTFRTESTYQDYRRPDHVTFVRDLKEDLMRRDFTINALAMNKSGDIFDFYDGQKDLSNKTIRAVGSPKERFHEDALRMMRGIRFSGQLGFTIEPQTLAGISENAHLLQKIAIERIAIEFQKLMASPYKQQGIAYLLQANLHLYCPRLEKLCPALDVFSKTDLFSQDYVNWGILLYLAQFDSLQAKQFLKQWKLSNDIVHKSIALMEVIDYRLTHNTFENTFVFLYDKEIVEYAQQFLVSQLQNYQYIDTDLLYARLPIRSIKDLMMNGRDVLNVLNQNKSGAFIGEILKELTTKVLCDELDNTKEALSNYIKVHFSHYKG